jgi:hypothetical protein
LFPDVELFLGNILLRVTWVASLFRGSLLGNSFVTRNKYWRSC